MADIISQHTLSSPVVFTLLRSVSYILVYCVLSRTNLPTLPHPSSSFRSLFVFLRSLQHLYGLISAQLRVSAALSSSAGVFFFISSE